MALLSHAVTSQLALLLALNTQLPGCSSPMAVQNGEPKAFARNENGEAGPVRLASARHPATEDLAADPEVSQEPDWISDRWPEVARIEDPIEVDDLESARAAVLEWIEPGLEMIAGDLAAARREELARRVDDLAEILSLPNVQLAAREALHLLLAERLADDDFNLLRAKHNLADTRYQAGDLEGSLELRTYVHAAWEKLVPAEHPDLLNAKSSLANSLNKLGDLDGALRLREIVHAIRERLLPPDHPDLLSAKASLASSHYKRGDIESALKLDEHVHAARERLLPPDHPDLLLAKMGLAQSRYKLGDHEGALELDEYVHAARERLLPPDHPSLLLAKANLASSRYKLGDFAGALELQEFVHAARERLLPADHPDLLSAKKSLAHSRTHLGDLQGALALDEYVHAARERQLPPDHPDLLLAKMNLASSRYTLGDLEGALELDEYVHASRERLLPPDHPSLLLAKESLASSRSQLGDLQGALALDEYVHAARDRLLPPDHPDLLFAKSRLASSRNKLGDLEGALELREHVHAFQKRLLPPDHPDLLSAKSKLANSRHTLGDIEGALELREYVHAARERLLPSDHDDLLSAKSHLANSRISFGDLEGALELDEYVHAARERLLPSDHPKLLRAKNNLADSRFRLGDHASALELREFVHAAEERLLPPEHPDLLSSKSNLANSRYERGDLEGALELDEYVYAARKRLLPSDHPDLLSSLSKLASSRSKHGDLKGLREVCTSLLSAQIAVAEGVARQAPRIARSAVLREFETFARALAWSDSLESGGGAGLDRELLHTLESLRLASTGSGEIARAAAHVPELAPVLDALARVRRTLADRSEGAPGDSTEMDAWRSELVGLAEERDGLEKSVRLRLEELGLHTEIQSAQEIAAGLGKDTALVSFLRYDRYLWPEPMVESVLAFVLTPDAQVRRVELGPAAELEDLVLRWRAQLGKPIERGFVLSTESDADEGAVGRALRVRLLDSCLAALGDEQPARVHVILDDLLHLIPIDALPNDDGTRVGESLVVHVETSVARLVRPAQERDTDGTLVAFGGVDYGAQDMMAPDLLANVATPQNRAGVPSNFAALLSSRLEAEYVCALFEEYTGGEPLLRTRAEASKAELVNQAPDARYLHVATHGWFAPESAAVSMLDRVGEPSDELRQSIDRAQDTIRGFLPETLCGLALAGGNNGSAGILTAEELATLDLTNCELAVLSACETNVGIRRAGQGIQSLQTALHTAGARTAITSLWKVDDAATRRLFEVFYTKLWKDGLGKADALWQAKMALRSEGHALRDWSGWVLSGDPQ